MIKALAAWLALSKCFQRCQRGFAFGCLLALALAPAQLPLAVENGALEQTVVVRASRSGTLVSRRLRALLLKGLLQLALGIVQTGNTRQFAKGIAKAAQNKVLRSLKPAIQKNGAQQRLKRIRQR